MDELTISPLVAISTGYGCYPSRPPYSPSTSYPEYAFGCETLAEETNHAYEGVRDALRLLRLDAEHDGQRKWNPLGQIIRPGETVVLKPNFVRDFRETQSGHEDCLITHGSVIRAAVDYVYTALEGRGRIIIADAPQNDADFDVIRQMAGLDELQAFYRRYAAFDVEVYDLRPERALKVNGVTVGHEPLPGDPAGYVKVDLGRHSMFCEVERFCQQLYGSEFDTSEIRRHHTGGVHEYLISKSILDADCVVGLPKLKTHKKTGLTVCMKNLVGINGNKNWLPHHRLGIPSQGGDQFADNGIRRRIEGTTMACFRKVFPLLGPVQTMLAKPLKAAGQALFGDTNTDTIRSGNWYGNDTTWRMVIDLNRILMYADSEGNLQEHPVRRGFSIVDGIVGGEGNGPLDPTPKRAGAILAGENPVAVDLTSAQLMGFDYRRLPLLCRVSDHHSLPILPFDRGPVACRSNGQCCCRALHELNDLSLSFLPHFGWQGHIEAAHRDESEVRRSCVE